MMHASNYTNYERTSLSKDEKAREERHKSYTRGNFMIHSKCGQKGVDKITKV